MNGYLVSIKKEGHFITNVLNQSFVYGIIYTIEENSGILTLICVH